MGSDLPDAIGRLRAEMWHPGPVLIPISDTGDERLEDYTRLTDVALRRKFETDNGLYMAESTKVIVRAITAGHRPRSVLADERWLDELAPALRRAGGDPEGGDIPVYVCEEAALQTITGFHLHRGAIAAARGGSSSWRGWSTTRTSAPSSAPLRAWESTRCW